MTIALHVIGGAENSDVNRRRRRSANEDPGRSLGAVRGGLCGAPIPWFPPERARMWNRWRDRRVRQRHRLSQKIEAILNNYPAAKERTMKAKTYIRSKMSMNALGNMSAIPFQSPTLRRGKHDGVEMMTVMPEGLLRLTAFPVTKRKRLLDNWRHFKEVRLFHIFRKATKGVRPFTFTV